MLHPAMENLAAQISDTDLQCATLAIGVANEALRRRLFVSAQLSTGVRNAVLMLCHSSMLPSGASFTTVLTFWHLYALTKVRCRGIFRLICAQTDMCADVIDAITRPLLTGDYTSITKTAVPPLSRQALTCIAKCTAEVAATCGDRAATATATKMAACARQQLGGAVDEQSLVFYLLCVGEIGRRSPEAVVGM
jgi:hypothetical protein